MNTISIVPRISTCNNKEYRIKQIIGWLIDIDAIVERKSVKGSGEDRLKYTVSDGAKNIVIEPDFLPFDLSDNGIEVCVDRQVFTAMGNGLDAMICPNCKTNIAGENLDFFNQWHSAESDTVKCPKCGMSEGIHEYSYQPVWGFSDLGFVFQNWPDFTDSFIQEFEQKLRCKVDVVYTRF